MPFCYSLAPVGEKIPWPPKGGTRKPGDGYAWLPQMQKYLGAKYALYLSSGRASLWLALEALKGLKPPKREVVLPAYTCPAIISAVLTAGLKPVLCDINLHDFNCQIGELSEKVSKETLAVIVVHLFGYPVNLQPIQTLVRKHDCVVIEDAAQAFGNDGWDGKGKVGTQGDLGVFSFGRGKPLSALHGGLLITQSETIYSEALRIYTTLTSGYGLGNMSYLLTVAGYNLFLNPYLYWIPQNLPFLHLGETRYEPEIAKTRGLHIAGNVIGSALNQIEEEKKLRAIHAQWYIEHLYGLPGIQSGIDRPLPYLRFPVILEEKILRDDLLDRLIAKGLGASLLYPVSLNELQGLKDILGSGGAQYPNAKRLADTHMTLPVHSRLNAHHFEEIYQVCKGVLQG